MYSNRTTAAMVVILVVCLPAALQSAPPRPVAYEKLPLQFIENQGQVDDPVAYYIHGQDTTIYFTPSGLTAALTSGAERWIARLDFDGASPGVQPRGEDATGALVSYFRGPAGNSFTGLNTYSRLVYRDLWPGIDLEYSGTVNEIKYRFLVRPGADASAIRLSWSGADLSITDDGRLAVATPVATLHDAVPAAWQEIAGERVPVSASYAVDGGSYGFDLGEYDPAATLVLDPAVLVYSGFIGGELCDSAQDIVVDADRNAYLAGWTRSLESTFPVTAGPDLTYNGGDTDGFVAKVSADGSTLIYLGYIGGDDMDQAQGIAVDSGGYAYIGGFTQSSDGTFPVAVGPDLTRQGSLDGFVAKLNPAGTELLYSGFLGGEAFDQVNDVTIDEYGHLYATGLAASPDFPVLVGPDLTNANSVDAFITKVTADGSGLVYSGFIGGVETESGLGVKVDAFGAAYVTGYTGSSETSFPVLVGPDLTFGGGYVDGFIAKVVPDGSALQYAGYIGGSGGDEGHDVALDDLGAAYIVGKTLSDTDFPVVTGPDATYNGGWQDGFVAKVSPDGSEFVYSGYIGGDDSDAGYSVAVDAMRNAYIVGPTQSGEATFPVLEGPDLTYNGEGDGFLAKLDPTGTAYEFVTYLGGSMLDTPYGVALDSANGIYVAGATESNQTSFPVLAGPDLTHNGANDAFITKYSQGPSIAPDGILNAASYMPSGLPNSGIAQGSLFIVLGEGIGPEEIAVAGSIPWLTDLGDTTVDVTVNGITKRAFLYYTWNSILSAVLPSDTPIGLGTLVVTHDGQSTPPAPIRVVPQALGIFTRNQAGYGPAIVQNWHSPTEIMVNGLTEAAVPGQTEIIWATGLGPIFGASDGGVPPVGNLDANVEVLLGDRVIAPGYAGRTGMGVPSIDQIQFVIPEGVYGCRVPLAVRVNGVTSNYTSMAIAPEGRVCDDPTDLTQAQLESIRNAPAVAIGRVVLNPVAFRIETQNGNVDATLEDASGAFFSRNITQMETGIGLRAGTATPLGTCTVYAQRTGESIDFTPDDLAARSWLDAGATLTINGPQGTAAIDRLATGRYASGDLGGGMPPETVLPSFLTPGPYTVSGTGGTNIGPFEGTLQLPGPANWTNRDAIGVIPRTSDLTVTWEGVDDATEFVVIGGQSSNADAGAGCSFICTAAASAGAFTVPARVLGALPASSAWTSGDGTLPTGVLAVGTQPWADNHTFSAVGLNMGVLLYVNWNVKNVVFE